MHRIFRFLDARTTELGEAPYVNPVASYTSPAQLAREKDLLFGRQPLFVGLSGDVAKPGDYLVRDDTGLPILLVRGASGELCAFLGLCRHRGAPVASGAGQSNGRFVCPYHGWTYDDAGELVAQPCSAGFSGLSAADTSLRPLPVAERHGMIFARQSGAEPVDIDAHLGGAEGDLGALGLQDYVPFARRSIERAMNWKLVIDTFLEAYHVTRLHAGTLGPAIMGATAAWDAFGRSSRLVAVRRSIARARQQPESAWNLLEHAVVLYLAFPNTMLIHQIDHLEVVQAYPGAGGADTAKVVFTLYTPNAVDSDAARRHFQANFDLLLEVTENEDFRLGEQIQRGFHAPGAHSIVYGRNEPGLAHYHRAIRQALDLDGTAV